MEVEVFKAILQDELDCKVENLGNAHYHRKNAAEWLAAEVFWWGAVVWDFYPAPKIMGGS